MKLYVAGKSAEVDRVDAFMRAAESLGHEITFDWTVPVRAHGSSGGTFTSTQLTESAMRDVEGVLALTDGIPYDVAPPKDACNVFVLLWHPELKGALVELGMALVLPSVRTVLVGAPSPLPLTDTNIFLRLMDDYFATDAEALAWLKEIRV